MLICGLKLSHDASVTILDDWRLVACVEVEKIANNVRYSEMGSLSNVSSILGSLGLAVADIDHFVLDGWHDVAPQVGAVDVQAETGEPLKLRVASYNEGSTRNDTFDRMEVGDGFELGGIKITYSSFKHVAGHIMSAYCSSPFAARNETAYILVWDGGQYPRLYFYDPRSNEISNRGHILSLLGTIYGIMGHYFGPYKRTPEQLAREREERTVTGYFGGHSIAGKLMSYIGLGTEVPALVQSLTEIYRTEFTPTNSFEHKLMQALTKRVDPTVHSDADVLRSVHAFIEGLLLQGLARKIDSRLSHNLCFAGGSALNIKWNSAIRASGIVDEVWVPPFPNDSGNGIGAACCELISRHGPRPLEWTVYSGSKIGVGTIPSGWAAEACSVERLAHLIATDGEPVVVLNGRAELGPRALGNRSILAPASDPSMRDRLNGIKRRETFRPVSPVCLEDEAERYFEPGTRDPYMLFDHKIRPERASAIPAVAHLDGTARLQTVSKVDNEFMFNLLSTYRSITGVPLLCNTSANFNGSGFFPDVESAITWGGARRIFSEGLLYEKR